MQKMSKKLENKERLSNVCIKTKRTSTARYIPGSWERWDDYLSKDMRSRWVCCWYNISQQKVLEIFMTTSLVIKIIIGGAGGGGRGGGVHTLSGIDSLNTRSIFNFLQKNLLCLHFLLNQAVLLVVIL